MRGNARKASRIAAYVASGALAITSTILAVTPAEAATHDPIGVNKGATWLQGQLTNGVVHNEGEFDFDDIGLTVDFALALDAIGGRDAAVDDIVNTVEPRARGEWYTSTFQGVTTTYVGSVAKALVLAQETGSDPTSFGGTNLVDLLAARTASAAVIAGRIQNENDNFGDANTIGQAYAAHGLKTANHAKATNATNFLLKQQCPNGGFRLVFNPSTTAAAQSCTDNTKAETDATAIAVLQLASQSGTGTVATVIANARAWLRTQQKADGSWGGGPTTQGSNANSTGLAAQALGNTVRSENAARWLRNHQVTPIDRCNALGGSVGSIAYDDAGRQAGRTEGITNEASDQWRRATAQALPAMQYLPFVASAPITLTGPSGFRKAGTSAALTTRGVLGGTQLCLNGLGLRVRQTPNADPWTKTFTLPAGTANRVYTVRDAYGHADTATVKVLGKKTLSVVTSKRQVKRPGQVTATVSGLTSGENARIYYKGVLKRAGTAGALGRMAATFNVVQSLGTTAVTATGHYPDIRRGATTIKVVR